MFAVIHGVEDGFDARGDTQLVEDPEQVLLHGVLAKSQFLGDLFVREAFGDERDHLFLARSEQTAPASIDHSQFADEEKASDSGAEGVHHEGGHLGDQVEEKVNLLGAGPNLASMDDLYALAKQPEGCASRSCLSGCIRVETAGRHQRARCN